MRQKNQIPITTRCETQAQLYAALIMKGISGKRLTYRPTH